MKTSLALVLFLLTAWQGLQGAPTTCFAFADDCQRLIVRAYNPDLGEICVVDERGNAATIHIYDANGNLIGVNRTMCRPSVIDPC